MNTVTEKELWRDAFGRANAIVALEGGELSERWRSEGIGPKFLKLPGRVLYRQVDIEAFEESCLSTSTKTLAVPVRFE